MQVCRSTDHGVGVCRGNSQNCTCVPPNICFSTGICRVRKAHSASLLALKGYQQSCNGHAPIPCLGLMPGSARTAHVTAGSPSCLETAMHIQIVRLCPTVCSCQYVLPLQAGLASAQGSSRTALAGGQTFATAPPASARWVSLCSSFSSVSPSALHCTLLFKESLLTSGLLVFQ